MAIPVLFHHNTCPKASTSPDIYLPISCHVPGDISATTKYDYLTSIHGISNPILCIAINYNFGTPIKYTKVLTWNSVYLNGDTLIKPSTYVSLSNYILKDKMFIPIKYFLSYFVIEIPVMNLSYVNPEMGRSFFHQSSPLTAYTLLT